MQYMVGYLLIIYIYIYIYLVSYLAMALHFFFKKKGKKNPADLLARSLARHPGCRWDQGQGQGGGAGSGRHGVGWGTRRLGRL